MSAKDLEPWRTQRRAERGDRLPPVQILQGLTWQSYYIAAGIGEIDDFLKGNEAAKETIIESHPELCFRGLLGHQFSYSKKSAQGTAARLSAGSNLQVDHPEVRLQVVPSLCGRSGMSLRSRAGRV